MPHTHHSHSGQFCSHAKDSLALVLETAISRGMTTFCMTEHIPRSNNYLYPGELEGGDDHAAQEIKFERYVIEAKRLRAILESSQSQNASIGLHNEEKNNIEVLIGLEGEWIDPEESPNTIHRLMEKHQLDYFIGSIHHVRSIPIDYDTAFYLKAMNAVGNCDEDLFLAYFQEQEQMLRELRPRVVGHFDLIRLLATRPVESWLDFGEPLWRQIQTNLRLVQEHGGLLEINTSGLRKGLSEPYPRSEICREWIAMGGDFVLSDDSHGIDHLGTCYPQALDFIKKIGLQRLCYLTKKEGAGKVLVNTISVDDLEKHRFYANTQR